MNKESICRNCFHSYVCEQFNENKDDNNTECHFANDHYIPAADVVPREEITKIFEELDRLIYRYLNDADYSSGDLIYDIEELKKKYTEER